MGDDLKKYEVPIGKLPIWYYQTIEEFLINYCNDMHPKNKLLLLHMLEKLQEKPEKQAKVVKLRKFG